LVGLKRVIPRISGRAIEPVSTPIPGPGKPNFSLTFQVQMLGAPTDTAVFHIDDVSMIAVPEPSTLSWIPIVAVLFIRIKLHQRTSTEFLKTLRERSANCIPSMLTGE
jgi:hypothetical protein